MRQLVLFWLFWATGAGLASAQVARPAETPPGDFPGAQYIDSIGCVFARSGRDWVPKLDDDGALLCGFPPSRSAWAVDSVTTAPSMTEIERDLTISLVETEGAGIDLALPAADAALQSSNPGAGANGSIPMPASPGPARPAIPTNPPAEEGPGAEIQRALRADPVLAARITAAADPNTRLCTLLGLQPSAKAGLPLGADPTRGYCIGLSPQGLPGPQAVTPQAPGKLAASALASAATKPAKPARAAMPPAVAAAANPAVAQPNAAKAAGDTAVGPKKDHAATKTEGQARANPAMATDKAEQVPANARYVQIGQFNPDGVAATIAAIRAMGYPLARQTKSGEGGRRIILAGPFETRERLIAALDRLRRAGYSEAFAR